MDNSGAEIVMFPQDATGRLRVALRQLDQALAEQKAAMAAFRREMTVLHGAIDGLAGNADELRERLAAAADDTARAQDTARRLVATAAAMQITS